MICLSRTPSRIIRIFVVFKIFLEHLIFQWHLGMSKTSTFFILYHKPLFCSPNLYTHLQQEQVV